MQYQIKTYSINDLSVPKKTLSFSGQNKEALKIKSDISFSSKSNGGQQALRISINERFNSQDYEIGDLVRITLYSDMDKDGTDVYFGYIGNFNRIINQEGESIDLSLLGSASLLRDVIYENGGSYSFVKNDDPSNILTEILNLFNSKYSGPIITFDPLPLYGSNIELEFTDLNCLQAIRKIHEITGWVFFIDGSGNFTTRPKTTTVDNRLTLKKEINTISITGEREDIKNRLIHTRNGGVIKIYEDSVSIAKFGVREERITDTTIGNEDTQDDFGNNFILENAFPKQRLSLSVNNKADFSKIVPGNLIKIKNIDFDILDGRIVSTTFNSTELKIACEKFDSFGQEVVNPS